MLVWDATCTDTLAPSHSALAIREAGAVAASAEQRKRTKYLHLETTQHFVPAAVETLGPIGEEGRAFLKELGRSIAATCFEPLISVPATESCSGHPAGQCCCCTWNYFEGGVV